MSEKLGIKETKEALVGVNELSLKLCEVFKDGAQISDVAELWDKLKNDPEASSKLMAAYQGASQIPAEIKDLDLGEGAELAVVQISYVPKFIEALKKAPAA